MQKRWKIVDGKRRLFKKAGDSFQEPHNEIIGAMFARALGAKHVD